VRLEPAHSNLSLARIVTATMAAAGSAALLVLDIDDLRRVHLELGELLCAELVRQFGRRIVGGSPPSGQALYLGRGQFALVLPAPPGAVWAEFATDLLERLCRPYRLSTTHVDIAASIGIALAPMHGDDAGALLYAGRVAVALAGVEGGRSVRVFNAVLCEAAQTRASLRAALRPALEAGEFVPYYQPIVCLRSGQITGLEVLARWNHPQRGLLAPDQFMAMMEEQHLCAELSLALLRQVVADAKWFPRSWTFAFNASPGQLRKLPDFITELDRMPRDIINPRRIELELTETIMIRDMALAREIIQGMHSIGAKVVLDDFGTGFANVATLRELPFDRIKIDRGFVHDMMLSARAAACVRAMLGLARDLGTSVVAEGVEDALTLSRLRQMECDFAQGYYYAPPLPPQEMRAMAGSKSLVTA
jgi:predicted signal transduction protein with EAL and GGDEF domain